MEILRADPSHDAALVALAARCFPGSWPADRIARLRDSFTVALEGGAVVGYIVLSSVLDEGSIDSIAVAPSVRRQGVADVLVEDAVAQGRAQGLSLLTLEVRAGNEAAIALYRKHGFAEAGRRKNYYEKPREDAILMTLVI